MAAIVRTTLGPRAMLKMLLDPMGGIVMTNDGNAILREVDVSHPAAKNMIEPPPQRRIAHGVTPEAQQGARRGGGRWHDVGDHPRRVGSSIHAWHDSQGALGGRRAFAREEAPPHPHRVALPVGVSS